jgi:hypothetical protein
MKTKIKTLCPSLGGLACAGALLIGSSASAQNLFISSYTPGDINEYTPAGVLQSTFATGQDYPYGLAFNSAGDLFVANTADDAGGGSSYNGYITKITPAGVQSTFYSGVDAKGLAFNSAGDLFEADYKSGNIYEYTPAGVQSTFASGFITPCAMAFNNLGDLFVGNGYGAGNGQITEITPGGVQSTFASGLDSDTSGLAFNRAGDLFEADGNGDIYEYTPNGTQSVFASEGSPCALAFNGAGDLIVTDNGGEIYSYTPGGARSTIATGLDQPAGIAIQGVALPVPEPSSLALLAAGASALFFRCRRKN